MNHPIEFSQKDCFMLARILALGILFAAVPPAFSDDEPKIVGDLAKLQGTWEAMAGPSKTQKLRMTVEKTELTLRYSLPGREKPMVLRGRITLDESAQPKAMDWLDMHIDAQKLPPVYSIYELKDDSLRVRGSGEKVRPTEFQDDDDVPRHRSLSFQRVKDAAP